MGRRFFQLEVEMLDVLVEILYVPETLPFDAWRFIG
jgi:hypothetical protein